MRKALPQQAELVELRELRSSPENFAAPNMSRIASTGNRDCDQEASKRKGPANRAFDELLFLSVRSSARTPGSLAELGDLMRQARDLAVRIVAVNDVVLRRLHQLRLGALHGRHRCIAVAGLDCFLDGAHRSAQLGPARLVDDGAAGNLAGRLLGGSRIGHLFKYPSTGTDRGWPGSSPALQTRNRR